MLLTHMNVTYQSQFRFIFDRLIYRNLLDKKQNKANYSKIMQQVIIYAHSEISLITQNTHPLLHFS